MPKRIEGEGEGGWLKESFGENKSDACGFSVGCRVTNEILVPFCLQYCPRCGVASLVHTQSKPRVHITCVYVHSHWTLSAKNHVYTFLSSTRIIFASSRWTREDPMKTFIASKLQSASFFIHQKIYICSKFKSGTVDFQIFKLITEERWKL